MHSVIVQTREPKRKLSAMLKAAKKMALPNASNQSSDVIASARGGVPTLPAGCLDAAVRRHQTFGRPTIETLVFDVWKRRSKPRSLRPSNHKRSIQLQRRENSHRASPRTLPSSEPHFDSFRLIPSYSFPRGPKRLHLGTSCSAHRSDARTSARLGGARPQVPRHVRVGRRIHLLKEQIRKNFWTRRLL